MAVNRFLLIIFAFSFLSGTLCESPAIKKFNWKLKNSVNFNNNDFSFPTANLESVDNGQCSLLNYFYKTLILVFFDRKT